MRAARVDPQRGPGCLVVSASIRRRRSTAHEVWPCAWTGRTSLLVNQVHPPFAFPAEEAGLAGASEKQGHVLVKRPKKVEYVFDDVGDDLSGLCAEEQLKR
eukprot:1428306-Pyramimonas_sp.AAC.1